MGEKEERAGDVRVRNEDVFEQSFWEARVDRNHESDDEVRKRQDIETFTLGWTG